MSVALGITTFNRPEYAEKCGRSIVRHLRGAVDHLYLYNDGSDSKHRGAYERAYAPLQKAGATIIVAPENHGVSYAKDRLLERMLEETDAEWLFLIEDDIRVLSEKCITQYVRVAEKAGIHHLSFAHHGIGNATGPVDVQGRVAYYPHSIGAFTMFSRECLSAGLMNENLHNAWEHVEHELRLMVHGYMQNCAAHRYHDVVESSEWLAEIPGSIERSSIRVRPDWESNIREGLRYWRDNMPETFNLLFGEGTSLEVYAQSILS